MKKRSYITALILIVCLLLCACGKQSSAKEPAATPVPAEPTVDFSAASFPKSASEITVSLAKGETALLDSFNALERADLTGSEDIEEVCAWAAAHPDVRVSYTVSMPDGSVLSSGVKSVDLSDKSGSEIEAWGERLRLIPKLCTIELGSERGNLGWDSIRKLRELCPEAELKYSFCIYEKDVELGNTQLNLSHYPVYDGGADLMEAMSCMSALSYVDLDSCGMSSEECAAIRDAFPDVKVVWRVWFGDGYSVRTDVERILASKPSVAGMIYDSTPLRYCTDVKYLDIGHNESLTDVSFLECMPKLEVAIIAMLNITDISAIANCHELEYLEMQTTHVSDLSPLSGLTNLRHLNIVNIPELTDISPLFGLKNLERLWIGYNWRIPAEQFETMQAAAPNCEINTTCGDPTEGHWRFVDMNLDTYVMIEHMRYAYLREQFDNYADSAFSYSWNDPLCY